jgi:hypothetical protein
VTSHYVYNIGSSPNIPSRNILATSTGQNVIFPIIKAKVLIKKKKKQKKRNDLGRKKQLGVISHFSFGYIVYIFKTWCTVYCIVSSGTN